MAEPSAQVTIVCNSRLHLDESIEVALMNLQPRRSDWSLRVPLSTREARRSQEASPREGLSWTIKGMRKGDDGVHRFVETAELKSLDREDIVVSSPLVRDIVGGTAPTYAEYEQQIVRERFAFECDRCREVSAALPKRRRRPNRLVMRGGRLARILDTLVAKGVATVSIDGLRHADEQMKRGTTRS